MKSGWRVAPKWVSDITRYQVYRLLDIGKADTEDNREYQEKLYYNKDQALKAAKLSNIEESERFWKGCPKSV